MWVFFRVVSFNGPQRFRSGSLYTSYWAFIGILSVSVVKTEEERYFDVNEIIPTILSTNNIHVIPRILINYYHYYYELLIITGPEIDHLLCRG